jgi:hypothetical protein
VSWGPGWRIEFGDYSRKIGWAVVTRVTKRRLGNPGVSRSAVLMRLVVLGEQVYRDRSRSLLVWVCAHGNAVMISSARSRMKSPTTSYGAQSGWAFTHAAASTRSAPSSGLYVGTSVPRAAKTTRLNPIWVITNEQRRHGSQLL